MFSPFKLLTLLVLALLATSAVAWKPINKGDAAACAAKNGDAATVIENFCKRFPYSVPSRDARIGRYSPSLKYVIKIEGNCKPAEKVSKKWCRKQFYNMCRNGKPNGTAKAKYGGGGCQQWSLLQQGWGKPG